jgi:hypothetical protein
MSFDLTISFDTAEYLNPQLYMMVDTLKENIPKDCILHITTNRPDDDPVINWIKRQVPIKIYKKPPFKDLKSRCQYMFHCFEVETDKDWVIKTEIDVLFLRKLREFNKTLDKEFDIILQSENRRVIPNNDMELRVWRNIYRAMDIKLPNIRLPYVENKEVGMPLLATGVVCVQSKHLDTINKRWIPLTKICEKWIDFGIHPNEFAFTGMIFDEEWDFKLFNRRYNFNPIGHFRKGEFPSTELIENCRLPSDIIVFDYHRPQWLKHVSRYNPKIEDIILRNVEYIPDEWWGLSNLEFVEK